MSVHATATDELRLAFVELMGAERRLRGRDQHRDDKLSFAHVRALFKLADGEADEMTAGQLAKVAELNPASVTGMLDHLERDGIVERHRSESDRRCVVVRLTDSGRDLLEHKRALWRELWEQRLAELSDDDVATAARVMREIAAMLDSL